MSHEIWAPFLGGVIIGISALMLMLFKGRIAGISGMFKGLIWVKGYEKGWRAAFIMGLIFSAILIKWIVPELLVSREGHSLYLISFAGLLVGIGTFFSNGCTSGHGVCGISRFSVRSIIATITFILTGVFGVLIAKQWMMI